MNSQSIIDSLSFLQAKLMKRQKEGDVVKVPADGTDEAAANSCPETAEESTGSTTEDDVAGEKEPNRKRNTTHQEVTETNKRLADKRDQQIREEVSSKNMGFSYIISRF